MKHLRCAAVALLPFAGGVHAATLTDAEATLICAVVDLASCVPGDGCQRETSATINVPQLIRIDQKSQELTGQRPDGEALSTKIEQAARKENQLILDGVQNGLSWTMTIAEDSGRMSFAAIGDGTAFTAFGTCATKE